MDSVILTRTDGNKQQAPVCDDCKRYPLFSLIPKDPEQVNIHCPYCKTDKQKPLQDILFSMNPIGKDGTFRTCEADDSHSLQNAVCFCIDCEAWICQTCKNSHLNSKTDGRKTHIFTEGGNAVTKKCRIHNMQFKYYCKECQLNLCMDCVDEHEHQEQIMPTTGLLEGKQLQKYNEFLREMKTHSQNIGLLYQKILSIIDTYKQELTEVYEKTKMINDNIYKMYQSFIEQASINKVNYHIIENLKNFGMFSFKKFKYDYNTLGLENINGKDLMEYKNYIAEGAFIVEKTTSQFDGIQTSKEWTFEHFVSCVNYYSQPNEGKEFIVIGFNNGTLGMMPLNSNKIETSLIQTKESHKGRILSIHVDGNIIYTSSADQTIRKWEIVINKENKYEIQLRAALRGHQGEVYKVLTVPEKNKVLSCSGDGTVMVWEPAKGQLLVKPKAQIDFKKSVVSIMLCKDNEHFVVATSDHKLSLRSLEDYAEKDCLSDVYCCSPGCLVYRNDEEIVMYGNNTLKRIIIENKGLKVIDSKEFNEDEHVKMKMNSDMISIAIAEDEELLFASLRKVLFKVDPKGESIQQKMFTNKNNIEGFYPLFANKFAVVLGKKVEIITN